MEYKLCDICDFQGGSQPPKEEWSLVAQDGYIRMLQIRDFTQSERVTPEYIKISGSIKQCREDDVLIARYGASLGKILTGLAGAYNVAIMKTIPDTSKIRKKYLYYYLKSPYFQNRISNVGCRAAQAGFNKEDLMKLVIDCPEFSRQDEIIKILSQMDLIIEEEKLQISKFDDLIKSRFVEMFGDEKSFELWPCCTVEDVAEVCVGVVIKPTQYYTEKEKGIPAFRSLNIGYMNVKDNDWVYFTEEGHTKNQKSIIRENDVLVVRSGTPGTACVASSKFAGCNAVDIIIAHPDEKKVNSVFLAMFTNMPHGMNQIRERISGAAQQHFNVGGYKALKLIMPPLRLQNKFAIFVHQVDKLRFATQTSLNETQQLFDSLMQKYFG